MNWTPDDAVRLRGFLRSTPNFIPRLRSKLTKSTGTTGEARIINSSERAGGENLIEEIERMIVPPIAGDKAPIVHEPRAEEPQQS